MKIEPTHITVLTVDQAYRAMVMFLEQQYERTKSDDFGSLLGSMLVLEDGSTADPAIAHHWWRAIEQAITKDEQAITKDEQAITKEQ